MSKLPARLRDQRPTRIGRAIAAQRQTELAVFKHHLDTRYIAECTQIDVEALGDVVRTALETELGVLDWGMEQATGSPAKAELVSRKVSMQSKINSARIMRRFGG
jgi:hypothetical protein